MSSCLQCVADHSKVDGFAVLHVPSSYDSRLFDLVVRRVQRSKINESNRKEKEARREKRSSTISDSKIMSH